ncbi:MAG TPA: ABC transporter substrate-binding protein [Solirubrobacteraceae bacterium]|jgi:peptide/nickel transport system substrate-binding protein
MNSRTLLALPLAVAALAAGCGGSDDKESSGSSTTKSGTASGAPTQGKQGGKLTVLYAADVDNIDPSITYYQYGFNVAYATQRPLYSYKPDDQTNPEPDLAEGPPEISDDAKTVTIKIKKGVKFSPPVNREVTSKDVKYAIERGFTSSVPNGYNGAYMGDLIGAKTSAKPGTEIPGIETPDDQTVVFKLSKPTGAILAGALVLPGSAPVPRDYALKYDKKNPSAYGVHQVSTGPYMVENDASGKLVGYKAGRSIHLVRNPNWDKATDYKPAYLDEIQIDEGNTDPVVASRRILQTDSMVNGDFQVPPSVLKQLSQGAQKAQLNVSPPTGRIRYVSFDTTQKPFDDVNVRKALNAAINRDAMRLAFGGKLVGDIPTHFIPPGLAGYEEAGGEKGPGVDFMANPAGDLKLAQEYMKKAGYASGKYDGKETYLMVADSTGVQKKAAQVALQGIEQLGFKVNFQAVVRDSMYTKFCQVPSSKVAICPSVGWLKDFADPQTMLDPTFNGKNILKVGNSNFPEFDDEETNAAMEKAKLVVGAKERAQAWADVDKLLTEKAAAVPWLWDKQPNVLAKNVNGVINTANASWDLTHTSLK